jgi:SAM-dependent methyltransferase
MTGDAADRGETAARLARFRSLYERQLELRPDDDFLRGHLGSDFVEGTERVFRFYRPFLPDTGRVLDWGCRHAPDACLLRAERGDDLAIDGCDVVDPDDYKEFYADIGLRYTRLDHPYRLPYGDDEFDFVIAAGVLEHVPMDYESLKELHRVMQPGGRLVISYLPNRWSLEERRLRRGGRGDHHARLYTARSLRAMLLHTGFHPRVVGYQTRLDLLPADDPARAALKPVARRVVAPFTSCLAAVADKAILNF